MLNKKTKTIIKNQQNSNVEALDSITKQNPELNKKTPEIIKKRIIKIHFEP